MPLVGLWLSPEFRVEEPADGIEAVAIDGVAVIDDVPLEETPILLPSVFEDRSPAIHAPLIVPPGALDAWFVSLSRVEADLPGEISRVLVWGDSTIASDRVVEDVRSRMQDQFGDGGLGFLAAQVDRYWSMRGDITRGVKGPWRNATIVSGDGAGWRYGLAGVDDPVGDAPCCGWQHQRDRGEQCFVSHSRR